MSAAYYIQSTTALALAHLLLAKKRREWWVAPPAHFKLYVSSRPSQRQVPSMLTPLIRDKVADKDVETRRNAFLYYFLRPTSATRSNAIVRPSNDDDNGFVRRSSFSTTSCACCNFGTKRVQSGVPLRQRRAGLLMKMCKTKGKISAHPIYIIWIEVWIHFSLENGKMAIRTLFKIV